MKSALIHHLFESSDINEHLPILFILAQHANKVVELGMGRGGVTQVLIKAKPKCLVSCDHSHDDSVKLTAASMLAMAKVNEVDFEFHHADSRTLDFGTADLLVIDTYGSYSQLHSELEIHHQDISGFICIHDTEVYAHYDEGGGGPGLRKAINDFLNANSMWKQLYHFSHNNGMTILGKTE